MTKGINDFIVDINSLGIVTSGGVLGGTSPNIGGSSSSGINGLRVFSRDVPIGSIVSAIGNNNFSLPVSFGKNLAMIFVDQLAYFIGRDFLLDNNTVTWLNPNTIIYPSSEVIAFGPANEYTAEAFTFEYIDLSSSSIYNSISGTIKLEANNQTSMYFPHDLQSIYLFVDGKTLTPEEDFTYNPTTHVISLIGNPTLVHNTNRVFCFYYNRVPTEPFLLGNVLTREYKTTDYWQTEEGATTTSYELIAQESRQLPNTSNVFINDFKLKNRKDYTLRNGRFIWSALGNDPYSGDDLLDISYFRDVAVVLNFYSEIINGTLFSGNTAPILNKPIHPTKGFLFRNGSLCTNQYFDTTGSPTADYQITGNTISWIAGLQNEAIVPEDKLEWAGFKDIQGSTFTKTSSRVGSGESISIAGNAGGGKVIYFLNGLARFAFPITANPGCLRTGDSLSLELLDDNPSDIVSTLYFTNQSYADAWTFHEVIPGDGYVLGSTWNNGEVLTLNKPALSLSSVWVFVNGVKWIPGVDYRFTPVGTTDAIENISSELVDVNTDELVLVYF